MGIVILIMLAIIIWLVFKNKNLQKEKDQLSQKLDSYTSQSKKIDESVPQSQTPLPNNAISSDNYDDVYSIYDEIQKKRPDYNEQFGRPFNYPKYTDNYNTNTDFTMRELLLLVWWGKVKKGRLVTARIPKYFIFDYNLNGHKVTQKFIDEKLLIEKDNRYVLSNEAKRITDFYGELWDMHQANKFPICLDEDFENWNHGALLATFYQNEIEYFHKMIKFYNKLISFYKKYPDFLGDQLSNDNQIYSLKETISNLQNNISSNQKLIQALA